MEIGVGVIFVIDDPYFEILSPSIGQVFPAYFQLISNDFKRETILENAGKYHDDITFVVGNLGKIPEIDLPFLPNGSVVLIPVLLVVAPEEIGNNSITDGGIINKRKTRVVHQPDVFLLSKLVEHMRSCGR